VQSVLKQHWEFVIYNKKKKEKRVHEEHLRMKCRHLKSSCCTFKCGGVSCFIAAGDWLMLKVKNWKDDNVTC
jgi:hypothetical protein